MSFFKNIFGKGPSFTLEEETFVRDKQNPITPSQKDDKAKGSVKDSSTSEMYSEEAKYGVSDKYSCEPQKSALLRGDDSDFYAKRQKEIKVYDPKSGKCIPAYTSRFERPPIYENCSLVILAVENSEMVNAYQSKVLSVINKIISDNKSNLFMFFTLAQSSHRYDLMSYEKLEESNLPTALFTENIVTKFADISSVMEQIHKFVSEHGKLAMLEYCNKKYKIQNIRILFVGTGLMDENEKSITAVNDFLNSLKNEPLIKSIKYFCIKDQDSINVAKMGFPIIGHLESNFYK